MDRARSKLRRRAGRRLKALKRAKFVSKIKKAAVSQAISQFGLFKKASCSSHHPPSDQPACH